MKISKLNTILVQIKLLKYTQVTGSNKLKVKLSYFLEQKEKNK